MTTTMTMTTTTRRALLVLLLLSASAAAEAPKPKGPPPGGPPGGGPPPMPGGPPMPGAHDDPIAGNLYPPELIMSHQDDIGLDDKQREAILSQIETAQGQMVRLQWQLQAQVKALSKLLGAQRVDEAKALAQVDKVMALEQKLKRTHLGLLIRIKNLLTDVQRSRLSSLRLRRGLSDMD